MLALATLSARLLNLACADGDAWLEHEQGAQRSESVMQLDDHVLATRVMESAEALGPVRRWAVHRRGRRVFGALVWVVADVAPAREDGASLALLFAGSHPKKYGLEEGAEVHGLLQRALITAPARPS